MFGTEELQREVVINYLEVNHKLGWIDGYIELVY